MVPIIQSLAQMEKNYGREGASIILDNCQDTIFGGFAPNSDTADTLSKSLGKQTVMSGHVTTGKNDPSQSLQMMGRDLMTPDELKALPKGSFIVTKTGTHPMKTKLELFFSATRSRTNTIPHGKITLWALRPCSAKNEGLSGIPKAITDILMSGMMG